jgi:hypothetical protein
MLLQKSIYDVSQVTRDLLHPSAVWLVHDARNLYTSGCEVDDEQHVVPNQTSPSDSLDGEEVHGCDGVPMSTKKDAPRHALAPLGRGREPRFVQDALDGIASGVMSEVEERAADSRVTPSRIVVRRAQHELDDVGRPPRLAATASSAAVVLARDESSIPSQQGCLA